MHLLIILFPGGMGLKKSEVEEIHPLLVQLDGVLYDIQPFAAKHPGGEKVTHGRLLKIPK